MISAKVICDSVYPLRDRLITVEVEFHRFILAEVNTHRMLSRNFQSSRAVPVEKMIEQVRNNPAMPVHWGKNQRGMVAEEESSSLVDGVSAEEYWKESAVIAAQRAEEFSKAGYHKQVTNRILEPFMWTKGVITGTSYVWNEVFKLRCHPDTQPEFQALAYKIKEAISYSTPDRLVSGDWHMPYVKYDRSPDGEQRFFANREEGGRYLTLENALKVSSSCCAQVSYRSMDDSLKKAINIYEKLNLPEDGEYGEDPPHFSPTEHQARAGTLSVEQSNKYNGNFHNTFFMQYRKILEQGAEATYIY